jgi:signal transduction histidine kinase/CHASE3 domain sensor protein/FixJ family two-component response regulator
MALHAAASRQEREIVRGMVRNANALTLAAALLMVATVGLLLWFQYNTLEDARQNVQNTQSIINTTTELEIAIRDAETGQRGYLLTGDEAYLAPYRDAQGKLALHQGELHRLTAEEPALRHYPDQLGPLVQARLEVMAQTIQLRRDVGLDSALAVIRTDRGRALMQGIAAVSRSLREAAARQRQARQEVARRAEDMARALAIGGVVLALVLLAVAARLLSSARSGMMAAEAEQRALVRQMQTAFDSISQGIGVFDRDGRLVRWNECFPILLDLPAPLLMPGMAYAALAEHLASDAAGGFALETEAEIRHGRGAQEPGEPVVYERQRAGDGRSFEIRRTAMAGDGGFVLTLTDITDRVRSEASVREAQRMQAMGQLTGGIAHDFNNLLAVVIGNLELSRPRLPADSPLLPRIERAIWAARRGAGLTQHLLAFARRQPLAPAPINLIATLPEMTSLLRRTLGEHIDVRVVEGAGLWPAMADAAQVESALLNLALNARDAMPNGGRLTIELANKVLDRDYARQHQEVTPGDYVMLAVSDTGTGMTPEVMARVFEPFFTTKPPGQGTGLGLAMVYGFAKQSNGHVKVYSEPGQGTTVRLYLPRAIGAVLPPPSRVGAPAELPRGSATVLLVEDEASVREVTGAILRELGYRVLEAGDGPEALRVFGENAAKVDLLLADVILPGGMKGSEVAQRLTEIAPGLRTLFISGYTENAIVHHGRLDDGVHLIGKPFSREALAMKVAEVLGTASATPPASTRGDNVIDLGSTRGGG